MVLRDLPGWFGIEQAALAYMEKARGAPFFTALENEEPIGFLYLHAHNPHTMEVYCMGVVKKRHRAGAGRMLIKAAEDYCREQGAKFLTVKTLAEAHPDPGYAKTRRFYLALGFVPLEVFDGLWGAENPCLFLAKGL